MIIKNGLVFRGKRGFIEDTLYIQDGRFTETADGEIIDAAGCYVIPGLVDIHFHGAAGYDLCDASAQTIALGADHLTHTCNAMVKGTAAAVRRGSRGLYQRQYARHRQSRPLHRHPAAGGKSGHRKVRGLCAAGPGHSGDPPGTELNLCFFLFSFPLCAILLWD